MQDAGSAFPEDIKKIWIERLWLDYYNRVLLDKKVISQSNYRKMAALIRQRCFSQLKSRGYPTLPPLQPKGKYAP
ncbi:hypothetical protein SDC9_43457 [bioreactor metagenome]|jgi:hypothetical protein|uniref:Uncharacterized protein n=1 Tax=bioreactor metagenome TaxID=1076179 RepID=A0A644W131_9ZZZZ